MKQRIILEKGQKFGRLTVIGKDNEKTDFRGRHDFYVCQCECGTLLSVNKWGLIKGSSKSCGCFRSDRMREMDIKHGLSRDRVYSLYYNIRKRCYSPSHISYRNYGGRGIKMCEEWYNSPQAFVAWYKENYPGEGFSIDRIDVNGDYSPDNCKFSTATEQQRNRRDNRKITFKGKEYVLKDACEKFGVKYTAASSYYQKHKGEQNKMTSYFERHAI